MLSIRLFSIALIAVIFYACQKESLNQTGGNRLSKVITQADSMFIRTFAYDANGRLSVIEDSNSQTHIDRLLISYDNQHKIEKTTLFRYFASRNNFLGQQTDSFGYNPNNLLVTRYLTVNTATSNFIYKTFAYDTKGRLITDTTHSFWTSSIYAYSKFTYDEQDNIVQWEKFENKAGRFESSGVYTATYSTVKNPLFGLGIALPDYNPDEPLALSRHLPIQVASGNNLVSRYHYNTYSNGLPKESIESYSNGSERLRVRTYFYE